MLEIATSLAKGDEDEKVPVSLKVPKTLKEEFEALCKARNVSMNAMFCAMAKVAVDEEKGIVREDISPAAGLELYREYKELNTELDSAFPHGEESIDRDVPEYAANSTARYWEIVNRIQIVRRLLDAIKPYERRAYEEIE